MHTKTYQTISIVHPKIEEEAPSGFWELSLASPEMWASERSTNSFSAIGEDTVSACSSLCLSWNQLCTWTYKRGRQFHQMFITRLRIHYDVKPHLERKKLGKRIEHGDNGISAFLSNAWDTPFLFLILKMDIIK